MPFVSLTLIFLYLFRHTDLKHEHKCGYEGGINSTHDVELSHMTEFNRIMRVSRINK